MVCRVAPVKPEVQDACKAYAEGAVRARPAWESGRKAVWTKEQLPIWGALSRPRNARQPPGVDKSKGT